MRRGVIVMAIGMLLLPACSGDGASAGTVATEAGPPPTPSTAITIASTTASTTTSSTTSTTEPTTTTAPTVDDAIRRAMQDYWSAYWKCGESPATCDPGQFLAQQGTARTTLKASLQEMVRHELRFSEDRGASHIVIEGVTIVSATEATVTACLYGAGSLVGPPDPAGNPTIVNNDTESNRGTYSVYLEGERWLVGIEHSFTYLGSKDVCGSAG